MQQNAIAFKADGLTLEGVVAWPLHIPGPWPIVVLCHAHPALAGTMDHPLLVAVSTALVDSGIAALRFNFRGVGGSEGEFTNGLREGTDVAAAVHVAARWPGVRKGRVGLLGYSFGAGVILRGQEKLKEVRAVLLFSPPPAAVASSRLLSDKLPKLFLAGQGDKISPPARLRELLGQAMGNSELQELGDTDHSWRGKEEEAARRCVAFFTRHLS